MRRTSVWHISLNILLAVSLLFCSATSYFYLSAGRGYLRIDFLDVGQGDSFLITSPDNVQLLVDGGRGNKVLAELQRVLPLGQGIDIMLATHPDADHIGGLVHALNKYQPLQIIMNQVQSDTQISQQLRDMITERMIEPESVLSGDVRKLGCCVSLHFLWPNSEDIERNPGTNEQSIAFLLEYGDFRLYAAGDLPSKYEDLSIENILPRQVTVLKVGHHGSDSSTGGSMLSEIKPEVAVIQVGAGNSYGHPKQSVIESLLNQGVKIYRTDQSGLVSLTSDGESYNFIVDNKNVY